MTFYERVCMQTYAQWRSREREIYIYICLYFKKEQLKNKPKTKGFINRKMDKQDLEHSNMEE